MCPTPDELAPQPTGISRRGFLKLAGFATIASAGAFIPDVGQQPESHSTIGTPPTNAVPEQSDYQWNYGDTAQLSLEGLAICAAEVLLAKSVNLSVGNAGTDGLSTAFNKHPAKTVFMAVGVAPIIEEGVFRQLPSRAANYLQPNRSSQRRWGLGILSSALFAGAHGLHNDEGKSMVPIPQFTTGMFNWFLQRRGGYKHAVLSHALHNGVSMLALAASPKDTAADTAPTKQINDT